MDDTNQEGGTKARKLKLPSVWEYTDFRSWLKDSFEARKKENAWYSYGVLAQRAGFSARDFLYRVIQGERGLSLEGADRVADAMDLKKGERSYFLALVEFDRARTDQARELAWSKLQHLLSRNRNGSAPRILSNAHKQILSSWYHLAVRSLLEMQPDRGDWEALGKRLHPPRSRSSVMQSIRILKLCGLVEQRADRKWHATAKSIEIPSGIAALAARKFHRSCLKLANDSMETVPTSLRNHTGVTLGISKTSYEKLCQRLTEIRAEFIELAEQDGAADNVYQMTFSLFPLTYPKSWETEA